jgi:hypothetical protein
MELRERKDGQLHARASGERLKANFSFLGMENTCWLTDLGFLELSLPGRAWMSLLEPRFVFSLHC